MSKGFTARALPIALEHCRCFAAFQASPRITSGRSLPRSFHFRVATELNVADSQPRRFHGGSNLESTRAVWLFCRSVVRARPGSMICDVENPENLGYFFADDRFYSLS